MDRETRLHRRDVLRAAVTPAAMAALGTVLPRRANAQKNRRANARAFALIGDESHNSDYIRSALGSTLVQDAGLAVDFTDEERELNYKALQNYGILIIFRDGLRFPNGYGGGAARGAKIVSVPPLEKKIGGPGVCWMTEEQGKAVKQWVQEGGSLWAFHNNSQLSLMNKDYRDVEGAIYTGHPPLRPFKVKITNPNHPITKGVNDFVVTDEQHFLVYEKDPKYVLAVSVNEDELTYTDQRGRTSNTCESVWAYDYGKGRVCFMAPGHTVAVMWNPEYEKMQKNAVKWLLREA